MYRGMSVEGAFVGVDEQGLAPLKLPEADVGVAVEHLSADISVERGRRKCTIAKGIDGSFCAIEPKVRSSPKERQLQERRFVAKGDRVAKLETLLEVPVEETLAGG